MSVHLVFTLQVTYLAAPSILDPRHENDASGRADVTASYNRVQNSWLAIGLSLFILEEELRETAFWIGVRLQHFSLKQMCRAAEPRGQGKSFRDLPETMVLRRAYFRIPMALLTLLTAFFEGHITTLWARIEAGDGNRDDLTALARSLEEWPSICLAFVAGLAWWLLMLDGFQRWPALGTFSQMVLKMLRADIIFKFLPLYVPILFGFTTSMHAMCPQKTTHERWSSWWRTFESLVLFSLVGEPPDIALSVEGTGDSHPLDMLIDRAFRPDFAEGVFRDNWSAGFFVMLYVLFVLVVLVLMINLLIAMMSNTYEEEKESALLQWRILFARLVLRYELLNLPLAMLHPKRHERRVMVGDSKLQNQEYYPFRSYDKDAPLNLDGRGGDIFADGDEGDNAPPLPRVGPAEMSQKNVETVAKRLEAKLENIEAKLEDLILKHPGGLAAPAAGIAVQVKQPQLHAASDVGGLPRYKAASDMEVARPRPRPHPVTLTLSHLLTTSPFTPTRLHPIATALHASIHRLSLLRLSAEPHRLSAAHRGGGPALSQPRPDSARHVAGRALPAAARLRRIAATTYRARTAV